MKVTLDIDKLLEDREITREEYERLKSFGARMNRSHWRNVVSVFAIVLVGLGLAGLFPGAFEPLVRALRFLLESLAAALAFVGPAAGAGLVTAGLAWAAYKTKSGFVASLSALSALSFFENTGLFYSGAGTYYAAVKEPATTAALFAVLAGASRAFATKLPAERHAVAAVFSRTCVVVANCALWVGSIWGDPAVGASPAAFAVAWALLLAATGAYGARRNLRWLVNASAGFGAILFYTNLFGFFGANPLALLVAGLVGLAAARGLKAYNQKAPAQTAP